MLLIYLSHFTMDPPLRYIIVFFRWFSRWLRSAFFKGRYEWTSGGPPWWCPSFLLKMWGHEARTPFHRAPKNISLTSTGCSPGFAKPSQSRQFLHDESRCNSTKTSNFWTLQAANWNLMRWRKRRTGWQVPKIESCGINFLDFLKGLYRLSLEQKFLDLCSLTAAITQSKNRDNTIVGAQTPPPTALGARSALLRQSYGSCPAEWR